LDRFKKLAQSPKPEVLPRNETIADGQPLASERSRASLLVGDINNYADLCPVDTRRLLAFLEHLIHVFEHGAQFRQGFTEEVIDLG
jgi:hypothetical protein